MSEQIEHRVARVPMRICFAGEDLDWLGGLSACMPIDLMTRTVRRSPSTLEDDPYYCQMREWAQEYLGVCGLQMPPLYTESDGPRGAGIASSTAFTTGIAMHLLAESDMLSRNRVARAAYEVELRITNGGGMDHLSVLSDGPRLYQGNRSGLPDEVSVADWPTDWALALLYTGVPKSSKQHLSHIRALDQGADPGLRTYMRQADATAARVWTALKSRDWPGFCRYINEAHTVMARHGRSVGELERLRESALMAGFEAAKLTGSGGGGCLVAACQSRSFDAAFARLMSIASRNRGIWARKVMPATGASFEVDGRVVWSST